jgi:hypothetical protein
VNLPFFYIDFRVAHRLRGWYFYRDKVVGSYVTSHYFNGLVISCKASKLGQNSSKSPQISCGCSFMSLVLYETGLSPFGAVYKKLWPTHYDLVGLMASLHYPEFMNIINQVIMIHFIRNSTCLAQVMNDLVLSVSFGNVAVSHSSSPTH